MKFLVLVLLLLPVIAQGKGKTDEKIQKELSSRCKATFDIIKNKDLDAFVSLMPVKPGANEKIYVKSILDKRHKKWFVDGGGISKVSQLGVEYHKPSADKIVRYGAVSEAHIKLNVNAKNLTEETKCKFLLVKNGWFLTRLP